MRQRLAVDAPPTYTAVRNNFDWADHAARTLVTAGLIAWLAPETIVDPACGDGSILEAAYKLRPFKSAAQSDISEAQIAALRPSFPGVTMCVDIKTALASLADGQFDCIVLTETLEHMVDPAAILTEARRVAGALVASVPIGDPELGRNHEHLWSWDQDAFQLELRETRWRPIAEATVVLPGVPGNSQIWVAR